MHLDRPHDPQSGTHINNRLSFGDGLILPLKTSNHAIGATTLPHSDNTIDDYQKKLLKKYKENS